MSSNRIGKTEVYAFINSKKEEALEAKLAPMREKLKKMKDEYIEEVFSDLDLEELLKDTKSLYSKYSKVRDNLSYSFGNLRYITDYLGKISSESSLKNSITNCISWNSVEDISSLDQKINDTRSEITEEFYKLTKMAQSCSTGNKAVRILKEVGFDTSNIEKVKPKNEIAALSLNKNLLGINGGDK